MIKDELFEKLLKAAGYRHFLREDLSVWNAIPTAEGVAIIIDKCPSPFTPVNAPLQALAEQEKQAGVLSSWRKGNWSRQEAPTPATP